MKTLYCVSLLLLLSCIQSIQINNDAPLAEPSTILWKGSDLVSLKKLYKEGDSDMKRAVEALTVRATNWMHQGPWTVMTKPTVPPSGDKHDYVSLDKYYWPCNAIVPPPSEALVACDNKTGLPWVHHDGYVNPDLHKYDHDGLLNMTTAVISLSLGWYYTDNDMFAERAALFLDTWFLNKTTKMNPNLNFGHFIPGVSNGEHGAIIDSHYFPEMLDAASVLALSSKWSSKQHEELKDWFKDFDDWLRTSDLGKEEANATNNHGVWYDVQLGFIAAHVGDDKTASKIAKDALDKRVNAQITDNGQLPMEDARTKSWSYNEFCLNAFFHLGKLAEYYDTHIWDSRIKLALEWQLPYIELKKPWTLQQVVPFLPKNGCIITSVDQCIGSYFNILRIASVAYKDTKYEEAANKLPGIDPVTDQVNLIYPKFK